MKSLAIALIAAVTVNCFAQTVDGKPANDTDTLAVPYIDTLLPPFENKDASSKINVTAPTTPATVTATTTTTKNPIKIDENNILPELSIEALLPPLFEAKIGKEETTTTTRRTTTTTTRTTATTTTTKRPTTTTTKPTTTTASHSTTAALKPSNLKLPDLFLDPLIPPLFGNDAVDAKSGKLSIATATTTPAPIQKPTSFNHQQQTQHSKDQYHIHKKDSQKQQLEHPTANTGGSDFQNYKKLTTATNKANDKYVAGSQTHPKHVSLLSQQQNDKMDRTTEKYVAQHVNNNFKHDKKQHNYSFDFYLGSTTPKPLKSGLPTITPFPHRLGR